MAERCWWAEGEEADAESFGGGAGDGAFGVAPWNTNPVAGVHADWGRRRREERQTGQGGAGCNDQGARRASLAEHEERGARGAGGRIFPWTSGRGYDDVLRVSSVAGSRPHRVHQTPRCGAVLCGADRRGSDLQRKGGAATGSSRRLSAAAGPLD